MGLLLLVNKRGDRTGGKDRKRRRTNTKLEREERRGEETIKVNVC